MVNLSNPGQRFTSSLCLFFPPSFKCLWSDEVEAVKVNELRNQKLFFGLLFFQFALSSFVVFCAKKKRLCANWWLLEAVGAAGLPVETAASDGSSRRRPGEGVKAVDASDHTRGVCGRPPGSGSIFWQMLVSEAACCTPRRP